MKLSLKQKAFTQAVGILILSIFAGVIVTEALSRIPPTAIPYIALAGLLGLALNLLYTLNVSRLEAQESLKKLREMD